jgi:hypothetical protein
LYFHKGRKAKTKVLRAQKEKLFGVGRGQMKAQKKRCLVVPRQQKYIFFQNYAKGKKLKLLFGKCVGRIGVKILCLKNCRFK